MLLEHSFPSDTAQLEPVRHRVREALKAYGCAHEFIETSVLAVDEAISNNMRHGYGPDGKGELTLTICVDGAHMVFALRDFADPFDVTKTELPSTGEVRAGGYGLVLIHGIMDSLQYSSGIEGEGNLLEMRRRLQLATEER